MILKKAAILLLATTIIVLTNLEGQTKAATNQPTKVQDASLALTIYHNGALFEHKAVIPVKNGQNHIAFENVCPEIIPGSVFIKAPDGLLESYLYLYTPPTTKTLLQTFKGKEVFLKNQEKSCNKGMKTAAMLLSYNGNKAVIKTDQGIFETEVSKIVFPSLPENLSLVPQIQATLFFQKMGQAPLELLYLSNKLGWQANYTGLLSQDENSIEIQAFARLQNYSQMKINRAGVRLIAGNVRFGRGRDLPVPRMFEAKALAASPAPLPEEPSRQELFEYHLYEIPQVIDLAPLGAKNIRLFDAGSLPCKKKLVLQSGSFYYYRSVDRSQKTLHPDVILEVDTKDKNLPFPAGNFRIYKTDSKNVPIFVGQQRIRSVASGEKIVLNLGKAFDITARKKQLTFNRIKTDSRYKYSYSSSYEIKIHNSKDRPVTIFIREEIPGQWSITDENIPHIREDVRHSVWKMEIPASATKILRYSVRVID